MFENPSPSFDVDWIDEALTFEYVTQLIGRLICLEEAGENFSGVDYWQKHIFAFKVLKDDWCGESLTSFVGFRERDFEALTPPYNGVDDAKAEPESKSDPESEEYSANYKKAAFLIWEMLANASMWKVPHAHELTHSVQLVTLLDLQENEGMDAAPGTFGKLFRFGTVNLRQTREGIEMMPTPRPSQTWKKGVLEV
ncbi:uncharacterized protein N7473_006233 [Penicillium subrubescens]|uniref:Uncharacterized protein n=1 Tax=Penicillium subrubescens TaxID=1316194 RepID=A0A1Q5UEN5_9EURO|nr:uncharacterized protein N7473_006233 [Penicillium subrubescens]KAJ5896834.1 hypothetical protein N7473_006233 [Penicillium subrubescens]OKP10937.1 hypothetical protein PENSUB_3757 [Penicillium subrubescens]